MLFNYSRDATFSEAIQKTFDGQHPCKLCKIVSEGKKSERKQESNVSGKKLEPWVQFEAVVFIFPHFSAPSLVFQIDYCTRFDLPPVPPPKAA